MYNRYIPQPDGSFSRHRVPDQAPQQPKRPPHRPAPVPPTQQEVPPCNPQEQPQPSQTNHRPPSKEGGSIPDFLRQLLPKGLDTGDLLIILLLLLMAGDCSEDRNTALLTLVLYLFL